MASSLLFQRCFLLDKPDVFRLPNNMAADLTKALLKCTNFAAIKHKDQRRKDQDRTPYINHPIGVAFILTEEAGITNLAVIQAALLHDTVEDTDTSFDEIETEFGSEVAGLVREVTDDKHLPKLARKEEQIRHAPHASPGAKLVKLADKLYNLRDLKRQCPRGWSAGRVHEYFEWAAKVVTGLRGSNLPMEKELDKLFMEKNISVA